MAVRAAEVSKEVTMEEAAAAYRAHSASLFPARTDFGPLRGHSSSRYKRRGPKHLRFVSSPWKYRSMILPGGFDERFKVSWQQAWRTGGQYWDIRKSETAMAQAIRSRAWRKT